VNVAVAGDRKILNQLPFDEIWAVDFEFGAEAGENPEPVCLVAWELRSGRKLRVWRNEFDRAPPYPTGPDVLFVSYYASAEISCHLALGWPVPERVLDLFAEFRNHTNGLPTISGASLLGALAYHGLDGIGAIEKSEMRELVLRGGPWSDTERAAILNYCESDVSALAQLLAVMLPLIDLPRALLRGRYMAAAARMERNGVPIDTVTLELLRRHWPDIQDRLIADIDADYGVFEGRSFKADRFAAWLSKTGIPWPRLESGRLDLSEKAFREVARAHPIVAPLRELRSALSEMRLADLAVGRDGRNRTIVSAFRARTSRNQPSSTKFIFGPSVWLRGLIKPPLGYGVAYVDYEQQEFGIAAALSCDPLMMAAYRSGDPYLAFAKQAGAAPAEATKATHGAIREQFKACVLAVQYGMGAEALAQRIGQPPIRARELLGLHRETYRVFWRWSDAAVDYAMLNGHLQTVFGWRLQLTAEANDRSLRNFPMQANGAEMLRLTCCLGTERGIEICAPVHDAVLICAPLDRLDADVGRMQHAMREASRIVLKDFELRADATVARYPDRYSDERGIVMWMRVMALLDQAEANADNAPNTPYTPTPPYIPDALCAQEVPNTVTHQTPTT
jgi:DNA polymerase I